MTLLWKQCRNGQTCVILVANDLSKRTLKGVCFAAEEAHIDVLTMNETMDEIGAALGKRTGVIAVNDAGFANKMRTMCSETDNQQKNEESRLYDEEIQSERGCKRPQC